MTADEGDPYNFNYVRFVDATSTPIVVNLESSPTRSEVRDASGAQTINWSDNVITGVGGSDKGDDVIRVNERGNEISSSNGKDTIHGMGGDDSISVADNAGGDTVDCGENANGTADRDEVNYDPGDTLRNCESQREF